MAALNNVDDSSIQVLAEVGTIRYFKYKKLGSGTFGSVYEGLFQDEKIAVKKILREQYTVIEEELKTIHHRYLLRYLDIVKTEEFVYIAMELCAGTLEDLIKNKYQGPEPGPMEDLLLQTALGLKFLHEKNIIHRDIKPINILISIASSKNGEMPVMKLADFGLCKQRTDGATSFTNSAFGTPGWAAPEIMMTDDVQRIRFSADVFSLGCVFGYALTGGCHPFGDDKYLRPNNVKTGSINWPNERLIKNEEIKKFIRRMISYNPDQRPSLSVIIQLLKAHQMHYCQKLTKRQPLNNKLLKALKTCDDELQNFRKLKKEYNRRNKLEEIIQDKK